MPQDANCPKCKHIFPVTESRQAFTVACPKCDIDLTIEFKKPATPPEAGQPPYDLLVKTGTLPGMTPTADKKRVKDDDEDDEPKRRGGSAMIVLFSGALGLLFVIGGLGITGWFLFTQIDMTETTSNNSSNSSKPNNSPGGSKNNNNPKGVTPNPKGGPIGPPPDWPGGGPIIPQKPKDIFDLKPATGPAVPITAPELPADPSNVDLGSKVGAVSVGGGGRYIVMHFPDKGQLGVFDVSTAQVDFTAADNGNVLLAAGLSRVVMYVQSANIFRVYTLPGLKKMYDYTGPRDIRGMAMGSKTNSPLFVVGVFGRVSLQEVGTNGMKEVDGSAGEPGVHADWNCARALPDGTGFTTHDGFRPDQRTTLVTVENRRWKTQQDVNITPFCGGDGFFYGNGVVIDKFGRDQRFGGIGAGSNRWFVPAISGDNYFLKVSPLTVGMRPREKKTLEVTIHSNRNGNTAAVNTSFSGLPEFDNMIDRFRDHPSVPYDQHLFLIPEAKLLVTLTADKTRLVLRNVPIR